jgi:hypothetical protein
MFAAACCFGPSPKNAARRPVPFSLRVFNNIWIVTESHCGTWSGRPTTAANSKAHSPQRLAIVSMCVSHRPRIPTKLTRELQTLYNFRSFLFIYNNLGHLLFAQKLNPNDETDKVLTQSSDTAGSHAFDKAGSHAFLALARELLTFYCFSSFLFIYNNLGYLLFAQR